MATPLGYTRLQIILHWIAVLVILQQFIFHESIAHAWDAIRDGQTPAFDPLVLAHVIGGALVLLLVLWRLAIKARRGAPAMVGENPLQRALARIVHLGLYLVMILLPVSGAVAWFGGNETAGEGHEVLKAVILALVALHVLGAVYHQFVLKDGLMDRMRRPAE